MQIHFQNENIFPSPKWECKIQVTRAPWLCRIFPCEGLVVRNKLENLWGWARLLERLHGRICFLGWAGEALLTSGPRIFFTQFQISIEKSAGARGASLCSQKYCSLKYMMLQAWYLYKHSHNFKRRTCCGQSPCSSGWGVMKARWEILKPSFTTA